MTEYGIRFYYKITRRLKSVIPKRMRNGSMHGQEEKLRSTQVRAQRMCSHYTKNYSNKMLSFSSPYCVVFFLTKNANCRIKV